MIEAVLGPNLLCTGAAFVWLGAAGLRSPALSIIIDFEDGSDVCNFSLDVLVYGLLLIAAGTFALLSLMPYFKRTTTCLAIGALLLSTCMTMAWLFGINWVIQYGHVPALDAQLRTYDTDRQCWDGIVFAPPVAINAKNCFMRDDRVVCALCRSEYYRNEPTVIRSYRMVVALGAIVLLLLQGSLLLALFLAETRRWIARDLGRVVSRNGGGGGGVVGGANIDSVASGGGSAVHRSSSADGFTYQSLPPPPPPDASEQALCQRCALEQTKASAPDYEYYSAPRHRHNGELLARAHIYTPLTKTPHKNDGILVENTPLHRIEV
uniref:Actin rearrangement inducing factor-1 n=1 Tax=Lymantria dispar multicapsid nuclear polyhedrosis virus TaxID=10449 RepID=A0A1B1MQY4_NPVLD|nr:actin rearrangement inducing factor-1 [Lymantria dispar multiple nucleopolyhedrovirus]